MTITKKIGLAFIFFVAATVLLAFLVPDSSPLLGVPGTLLLIYVVRLVYRRSGEKGK
ncbi:hypothetical protein H9638_13170 [Arthrobacter sp. Sa2BUA2]|uniref:Uncharacterized protein n=1 Tax=Arthrobacter pullicola TaxID=2762224 RepID=A0ABR8YKM6_9MICC|nr:hypothetical protein [Arthrobacter pullicola]MBD8044759.1 hypothetical protein [Arthrobacter pullicola]